MCTFGIEVWISTSSIAQFLNQYKTAHNKYNLFSENYLFMTLLVFRAEI